MKTWFVHFQARTAIAVGILAGSSALGHSEVVTVSRRLVRFDGKPAVGAKVRILTDYNNRDQKPELEVVAGADGVFSVDITQEDSLWTGCIIVRADGCAALCELSVTGRRQIEPGPAVLRLGAPFQIKGRTTDTKGRPVAEARVSLVSIRPEHGNPVAFNSTTTQPITTPELIAQSRDGNWAMMGIDFVRNDRPLAVSAVFEAVADDPLRASRLELKLDPEPGVESRKNISVDFQLASLIHVAGRVVNAVTGDPVAGAHLTRSDLFTTIDSSSALTDERGRYDLRIPGPLPVVWFWVVREGFATTTVQTAQRKKATSDWRQANNLLIRLRPMVAVSGRLRSGRKAAG